MLLAVILVLIYSPLHYHFTYPTGGDDTAYHIDNLANLMADFGYIKNMNYYGIVLLLPFTWFGLSIVTVFSVFNCVVIAAIFITFWILLRAYYGLLSAVLSFFLVIFITWSTWYYFDDGTIFNIFNLFVIGILAIYSLCKWLECGKNKWLVLTGLLFIATSLIHNTTYLYIMVSMLLFFAGCLIFYKIKKNIQMFQKALFAAGVFSFSILTAWITWMHKQLPALGQAAVDSITDVIPTYAPSPSFGDWLNNYLNPSILLMLALAFLIVLAMFSSKKDQQARQQVISVLNQPLSYLLLIFMLVLAIGAFTKLGYNSERFGRDLASFVSLSTAILLGTTLTFYRHKIRYLAFTVLILMMILNHQPLNKWMSDYSALRSCDIQTIDFLNSITDEQFNVQVSATIAPWIFDLYTDDNVDYTRVFTMEKYNEASYFLYRNNDMTWGTWKEIPKDYQPILEATLDEMKSLVKVAEFKSENDYVVIYQVLK
jgi:hypothetical protein